MADIEQQHMVKGLIHWNIYVFGLLFCHLLESWPEKKMLLLLLFTKSSLISGFKALETISKLFFKQKDIKC